MKTPAAPDGRWLWDNEPCRAACPVHTDAGGYVTAIAEGRFADAYRIAREPNPFPSICGRVCAAPCETSCRRGLIDAPVSICTTRAPRQPCARCSRAARNSAHPDKDVIASTAAASYQLSRKTESRILQSSSSAQMRCASTSSR